MKVMEERIREKQAKVDKLELAINSLNISRSPVHMEFIPSPPVPRQRPGRREEERGMGLLDGGETLLGRGGERKIFYGGVERENPLVLDNFYFLLISDIVLVFTF